MYVVLRCAVQVTVIKIEFTTLDQTRLSICWPSGRTGVNGVKPGFVELVEPYRIGVDQRRSCSVYTSPCTPYIHKLGCKTQMRTSLITQPGPGNLLAQASFTKPRSFLSATMALPCFTITCR